MKLELKQSFQIESARFLPNLEKDHPCSRMHGHSFQIIITLVGEVEATKGWVLDYHKITLALRPLLDLIDHRVLNEIQGLENPTSELMAIWFYNKAKTILPELVRVTIKETPWTECSFPA